MSARDRTKARLLGYVLSLMLALVILDVATDRWGVSVPGVLAGLGMSLSLLGTALIANYLSDMERRERAELYHGETRRDR